MTPKNERNVPTCGADLMLPMILMMTEEASLSPSFFL